MRLDSKARQYKPGKCRSAVWDVCPRVFPPSVRSFRKHSRTLDTHNQVIADDAGTSSGTFQLSAINPRREMHMGNKRERERER